MIKNVSLVPLIYLLIVIESKLLVLLKLNIGRNLISVDFHVDKLNEIDRVIILL